MPKPWFGCGVPLLQRHWSLRWGECAHCGEVGFCPSYDATKLVVVFGIPVFPLGAVHVHEDCVQCQEGCGHDLESWESRREEVLVPALQAYATAPEDPARATAALQEVVALGEAEEFEALASQLEAQFDQVPEILNQLAWCHGHFANFDEAARVYERAGSLDMAKTYGALPEGPPPTPPSAFLQGLRVLIGPLLLIVGVTAYMATVHKPKIDTVYFVNGLPEPYSFLVDGDEVSLPALGRTSWTLSPGPVRVVPLPGSTVFEPFEFNLIASRGGRSVTAVVNPDRLAVISWWELVYQNTESEQAEVNADQFAVHAVEQFYPFYGITDHFEDPPDSLEIHSGHAETYRYVLHQRNEDSPEDLCALLIGQGEMDMAETYCWLQLNRDPEQHALLPFLLEFGSSRRQLELMEGRLGERPLRFVWHQHSIELARSVGDRAVAEARYLKLLEASPDDGDLHYLLGRTRESREAAISDYQRAGVLGSIDALLPLARWQLAQGNFEKALSQVAQISKARPEDREAASLRHELLLATSQYEPLLTHYRERLKRDLLDEEAAMTLAGLLEASGSGDESQVVVDRFIQAVSIDGALMSEETAASRSAFSAARAQWAGNVKAYVSLAERLDGFGRMNAFILTGDLAAAASSVERDAADPFLHFLLYALTARSEETLALSEVQLSQALSLVEGLPSLATVVAPWFRSGGEPPTLEETLGANLPNYERRVLLFALAQRHPEVAETYLKLVERLNYHRVFPYLALKQALLDR